MINSRLAKIFFETAGFLDARRVSFKPFAYRRAAMALEELEKDAADIYRAGGLKALEKIPGVGASIAKKIEEYILKGKIGYYEGLKRQLPVDLAQITSIQGVGPRRARVLYQKLGIKTVDDLEKAARRHKIADISGFGVKSEMGIIESIEFHKHSAGRFLLGGILPFAEEIRRRMEALEEVEKIDIAGSVRRKKETIGDLDFLAIVKPAPGAAKKVMDFFTAMPEVKKVWGKGATKSSVRIGDGFNMDLRVLEPESYGAALQYFTGSKDHNISLRRRAQELGLKLSEYGLFCGGKAIAGRDEKDIYEKLGLRWIEPELRENTGEIEAAAAGKLPAIIGYGDLKGDLHCHSDWDGGHDSIGDIAAAAMKMGYQYVGIADHTKFLKIEKGLDERALERRNKEIDKLNDLLEKERGGFKILKGCEANIMADGSIDISDGSLSRLDFAIAGVHSNFKMDIKQMTKRIIRAMENKNIDIISHPTGRLINRRPEYQIDFEAICAAAEKTGTILEINSYPDRLDLNDLHIRRAKDYGVKMAINTDAHDLLHLRFAEFGIAQARRGWAEHEDIINAYAVQEMLNFLKKN